MQYVEVRWLCLYGIRILLQHDVTKIPDRYILPRWTRPAKIHILDKANAKRASPTNYFVCHFSKIHYVTLIIYYVIFIIVDVYHTPENIIDCEKRLVLAQHAMVMITGVL